VDCWRWIPPDDCQSSGIDSHHRSAVGINAIGGDTACIASVGQGE